MYLYLDSDVWCFTIIFVGSLNYFKLVSCWIQFCENVAGIPQPLYQLPPHVGKVNRFTLLKCAFISPRTIEADASIIFVGSFPYFKFFTKINSKVRGKKPAKVWPVAGCFGWLPALIDSTGSCHTLNKILIKYDERRYFSQFVSEMFDSFQ